RRQPACALRLALQNNLLISVLSFLLLLSINNSVTEKTARLSQVGLLLFLQVSAIKNRRPVIGAAAVRYSVFGLSLSLI
ncbi:hypothetical protein, partial [Ruminococcus sp.]|uniref:hypothetical protein n=1 Tax=Ruminococcus sp. TaxID=41978 RepID=UPI0038659F70